MEQSPDTLGFLERETEKIIDELDSDYFRNLPGSAGK
jgi:hypothetical protein